MNIPVVQNSISVTKSTTIGKSKVSFTITYLLRQGEPFLRISTSGSLPYYYTAMVKFPLNKQIDNIMAGTPYHWNSMTPDKYNTTSSSFDATMWATHDFVIPQANGNAVAAIYHGSTPAWAAKDNSIYGVILRNTPNTGYGACGADTSAHTQEYALRIPSGLGNPDSGQPLMEARQYNTPMEAVTISSSASGSLKLSYSLASTSGNAIITTAKWSYSDPNALILRVYQPNNKTINSTLTLGSNSSNGNVVSSLEVPIVNAKVQASIKKSGSQYSLSLPRAVATFKID